MKSTPEQSTQSRPLSAVIDAEESEVKYGDKIGTGKFSPATQQRFAERLGSEGEQDQPWLTDDLT